MMRAKNNHSQEIRIRQAEKEDLAGLVDLENICFEEERFHKKQIEYLLFKARTFILVAETDNRIIGSMIILLKEYISHARIYSLNVHPAYRRAGIASSLLDTASEFLKEKGYRKISLEVNINNKAAQGLYISKGFSRDSILKEYYRNGDDASHLIKKL